MNSASKARLGSIVWDCDAVIYLCNKVLRYYCDGRHCEFCFYGPALSSLRGWGMTDRANGVHYEWSPKCKKCRRCMTSENLRMKWNLSIVCTYVRWIPPIFEGVCGGMPPTKQEERRHALFPADLMVAQAGRGVLGMPPQKQDERSLPRCRAPRYY